MRALAPCRTAWLSPALMPIPLCRQEEKKKAKNYKRMALVRRRTSARYARAAVEEPFVSLFARAAPASQGVGVISLLTFGCMFAVNGACLHYFSSHAGSARRSGARLPLAYLLPATPRNPCPRSSSLHRFPCSGRSHTAAVSANGASKESHVNGHTMVARDGEPVAIVLMGQVLLLWAIMVVAVLVAASNQRLPPLR